MRTFKSEYLQEFPVNQTYEIYLKAWFKYHEYRNYKDLVNCPPDGIPRSRQEFIAMHKSGVVAFGLMDEILRNSGISQRPTNSDRDWQHAKIEAVRLIERGYTYQDIFK